jgi:hypothetical protein
MVGRARRRAAEQGDTRPARVCRRRSAMETLAAAEPLAAIEVLVAAEAVAAAEHVVVQVNGLESATS